jgi:hypothetical protein
MPTSALFRLVSFARADAELVAATVVAPDLT